MIEYKKRTIFRRDKGPVFHSESPRSKSVHFFESQTSDLFVCLFDPVDRYTGREEGQNCYKF